MGPINTEGLHFLEELGEWLTAVSSDPRETLSCFNACLFLYNELIWSLSVVISR